MNKNSDKVKWVSGQLSLVTKIALFQTNVKITPDPQVAASSQTEEVLSMLPLAALGSSVSHRVELRVRDVSPLVALGF